MSPHQPIVLNDAEGASAERKAEVARVRLLDKPTYAGKRDDWRNDMLASIQQHEVVLDVGKSSRHFFDAIRARAHDIQTLDINVFEDYPDLLADLCQPIPVAYYDHYDVVIALDVLQCVYDPQAMIDNIRHLLKPGGRVYLSSTFIYRYMAPRDQKFQDFFRFSRDGMAYLFRSFDDVRIQPVRGQYSTIANMLPSWKVLVERRFGGGVGRWLDALADRDRGGLNASGYNVTALKPKEAGRPSSAA